MALELSEEEFEKRKSELSSQHFEQNESKILGDYFSEGDLTVLTYGKYFPEILDDLKTNPGKYSENSTVESFNSYFSNLGERYRLYNRPPVDPKIDVAETGGSPFQDFKEFLGFERNPDIAELQQAGFSGYEEYKDPNRNIIGAKGRDRNSLLNMSYYMPRNKTPRDLKFALNTIYEKTGQKGNAEWAFPTDPNKGIAIKQEGANDNKYVLFDLPQFTPMRDVPDFLQTESIPIIGELLAVRTFGARGGGKDVFKNSTEVAGIGKLKEWTTTAASFGFGAAFGDYLRLQYGSHIGAHDRTQAEMAAESGITGLLSTAGVGTLDAISRGLPLLKDFFSNRVIPDSVFVDLEESIIRAKRSASGKPADGMPVKIDTPFGRVSDKNFEITTPIGKLIRSNVDAIGTAAQEITTKELDEAVSSLIPGGRFILSNYSKAQYDRGETTPSLTLGSASLDKIAAEYEILLLRNSNDPKLKKIYQQILKGDQELMRRFLNNLNKNIGAEIDPDLTSNTLENLFKDDAYDQLDAIEKVTANALDSVLKSMGATDIAEGGSSLFKNVPDPVISTELFNKEQTRLREIRSGYTEPFRDNFLNTVKDPRYEKLRSGAGKTKGPVTEWANLAKQSKGILTDFDALSAKEDLYQILGSDGANTLRKLQGLGPKVENQKGTGGKFIRPEYTLEELNGAREILNKYASSQTDNPLSAEAARKLERGLEHQMYQTLIEGASFESGIPVTSSKKLGEWMQQNEYGIDIQQAAIDQRNAIYDASILIDIEKTQNSEEFVINLFNNKAGNVKNTKVENLVKVLTESNAPELGEIQGSAISVFADFINKPVNGEAPKSIERVRRAKQFINDNKGTLQAFFPKETYGNLNNFKQFEKIISDVENTQVAINEIQNNFNSGFGNIVQGILNESSGAKQQGNFVQRLTFLKPYLENNPILQAKTASVAKAWLLSNVVERGADGRNIYVPKNLDKILYSGFGPKETGLSFEDVMAPLIGPQGKQYVKNLEELDLIYKRYSSREIAVESINKESLAPQTSFLERLIFPPLTQTGRRVTAVRTMGALNSARYLGELLLSPDKLNTAIKSRKRRLTTQNYVRYMIAIGSLNLFDATNDYRNYNPNTKEYSKIKTLQYTGNSVNQILNKVGIQQNIPK